MRTCKEHCACIAEFGHPACTDREPTCEASRSCPVFGEHRISDEYPEKCPAPDCPTNALCLEKIEKKIDAILGVKNCMKCNKSCHSGEEHNCACPDCSPASTGGEKLEFDMTHQLGGLAGSSETSGGERCGCVAVVNPSPEEQEELRKVIERVNSVKTPPSTEGEWKDDLRDGQLVLWADLVRTGLFDKALENVTKFIEAELSRQAESFQKKLGEARVDGAIEAWKRLEHYLDVRGCDFTFMQMLKKVCLSESDKIRKGNLK